MGPLLVRIVAVAMIATLVVPAVAVSDGDPASDVLLGQSVFYPYSPPVAGGLQKTLNAETAAASRARFPLKVALIASPVDLGAIPSLFGKPQQYADFLDQEIGFFGKKQLLLVVMPSGYGVAGLSRPATDAAATLKPPAGSDSNDLARAAVVAVSKLAEAAGHPVRGVSGLPSATTSTGHAPAALAVGVLVCVAVLASATVVWLRQRRREAR